MNPSVAVIVTTYNAPDYLAKALEGYISQSRPPDELVIADDGSTEGTRALVETFRERAPFTVRYVWHEDMGFRAAKIRNEAVKESSAGYLIFTDGDCIPHHRFVEDHCLLARQGRFVQGKRMLLSRSGSMGFSGGGFGALIRHCLSGELSGCHHLLRIPGFAFPTRGLRGIKTCNFALWRDAFQCVNGFNEDFIGWGREDAELAARLYHYGLRRYDPPFCAMVFHLWHAENSRESLARNDQLLEEAVSSSGFYCKNGLNKG